MGWKRIALWVDELICLCCHCVAEGMGLDKRECGGKVGGERKIKGVERGVS